MAKPLVVDDDRRADEATRQRLQAIEAETAELHTTLFAVIAEAQAALEQGDTATAALRVNQVAGVNARIRELTREWGTLTPRAALGS